jgi:hypothetical protein
MNRFKSKRPFMKAVAVLATAFAATSAVAAPIVNVIAYSSVNNTGNTAGVTFAQGYAANTPTGATWTDDPTVPSGNLPPEYMSPFNSNSLTATTSYFAVNRDATLNNPTPAAPSPVTLSWGNANDQSNTTFSILWGSVDQFNTITFKDDGGTVYSYTGTQLASEINSTFSLNLTPNLAQGYLVTALVTFTFSGSDVFDAIEFRSENASGADKNAFEFALAPVPGPAAGLLFLTALGCLGFARRARATA